jgi:hypothetical protein
VLFRGPDTRILVAPGFLARVGFRVHSTGGSRIVVTN